jgi:adenosylcobinamide-GDP ribazoletransferase
MNFLIPIFVAAQFLTVFPPVIKRIFTPKEMGRAVGFFPLVGLGLGALLFGLNHIIGLVFSATVQTALVLTFWVLFTGALHLDGFLDSLDGLLGGFTPEKRLEIMHDERVGAFGMAGGVLLLLLKFVTLEMVITNQSAIIGLLLVPTLGRWALTVAIFVFPYARAKGLGRDIKDYTTWREIIIATLIAGFVAWFTMQWNGLIILGVVAGLIWIIGRYILKRIPGMTGDNYGAICELIEVVVLLFLVVRWPI